MCSFFSKQLRDDVSRRILALSLIIMNKREEQRRRPFKPKILGWRVDEGMKKKESRRKKLNRKKNHASFACTTSSSTHVRGDTVPSRVLRGAFCRQNILIWQAPKEIDSLQTKSRKQIRSMDTSGQIEVKINCEDHMGLLSDHEELKTNYEELEDERHTLGLTIEDFQTVIAERDSQSSESEQVGYRKGRTLSHSMTANTLIAMSCGSKVARKRPARSTPSAVLMVKTTCLPNTFITSDISDTMPRLQTFEQVAGMTSICWTRNHSSLRQTTLLSTP